MSHIPGYWMFIVSATIMIFTLILSLRRIGSPIGKAFHLLVISAILWNVAYLFELSAPALPTKLFFARIQFIGIIMIPIAWLYLSLLHTRKKLPRYLWIAILGISGSTLAIVLFVPLPNVFWAAPSFVYHDGRALSLDYDYGPWFFYVFFPFVYILLTASLALLAQLFKQKHPIYGRQTLLIISGTLIPTVVNVLYVLDISPVPHINYSTATLWLTGLLVWWALFRYRFLDLNPIARDVILEVMQDIVLVVDERGRIVDANKAALRLLGEEEDAIGRNLAETRLGNLPSVFANKAAGKAGLFELNGRWYDVAETLYSHATVLHGGTLYLLHDVTERETLHRHLEELGRRDPLTGVYNRGELEKRVVSLARDAGAQGTMLSLLMLDIDAFKDINDTYGHETGDHALETFAKILFGHIQPTDLIGRYGGDEFVIVCPGCDEAKAIALAESIREAVSLRVMRAKDATSFTIHASIGVLTVDGSAQDIPTESSVLLSAVDKALYAAKHQGRNRVVALERSPLAE